MTLGQYQVSGLYIKLNKKLILNADKVIIPGLKPKSSTNNLNKTFSSIKYVLTYFESIDLKEVNFKGNKLNFLYADEFLHFESDEYEITGNIHHKGRMLLADIALLIIKKEGIGISGQLKYFLHKDRLEIKGKYDAYNISGKFAAFKENDNISFALNSNEFSDLKTVTDRLPIKNILKQWIAYKIEAKSYKLYSFVGKARISGSGLDINFPSLHAEVLLKDVNVRYHDNLEPIKAPSIHLTYRNGGLYFNIKEPTYAGRDLNGSKVSITNLKKGKVPFLNLELKVISQLDETVQNIFKAYKLNIPVIQQGKNINADVNLVIALKKSPKVKTHIYAKIPASTIYLNDNIVLPVLGGELFYSKGIVKLKNVFLKNKDYSAIANGKILVKNKKAEIKVKVDYLNLGSNKKKYFTLKKKNITIKIDYRKSIIKIPSLGIQIENLDKKTTIKLLDIKKIKPYLRNIDMKIDGGKLDIVTKDFKVYKYSGLLKRNSCFFYDKDNMCHTVVNSNGTISKDKFILNAFDNRLNVDLGKSIINVNRLNIDLKEFLNTRDKSVVTGSKRKKNINIFGKNSDIRYGNYKLISDRYNIKLTPAGNIFANASLGKDKVKLIKKGSSIKVEANRIRDRLLHPLINFKGLQNGRYSFKTYGNPNKAMNGEVKIEGGVMSDFKAYNNTLAFINTLPALATLSNPGFSKKGFHIKKGIAKYRKIGEKIIFDTIHIEGKSASIVGEGEIDLKKNTINMNLAIRTARELGNVVGSLPILGYILMGEDKSLTVGLTITGSLSKPIVKTSATNEILKLPLDLIKRTLNFLDTSSKDKSTKTNRTVIDPEMFNTISP